MSKGRFIFVLICFLSFGRNVRRYCMKNHVLREIILPNVFSISSYFKTLEYRDSGFHFDTNTLKEIFYISNIIKLWGFFMKVLLLLNEFYPSRYQWIAGSRTFISHKSRKVTIVIESAEDVFRKLGCFRLGQGKMLHFSRVLIWSGLLCLILQCRLFFVMN